MQPSRRSVLAAGALALAAACRRKPSPAPPDPDAALRAAALEREQQLLAAYRAVLARRPALAPVLRVLAAGKEAHVAGLGGSPAATAGPTPRSSVTTVAGLRALERAAATAHGQAALVASRVLAPQLASLSASSSAALAVL